MIVDRGCLHISMLIVHFPVQWPLILLVLKTDDFFDRSTLTAGILEPLGVHKRYVSHFKGLISAKVDLEAQGHGITFTLCHSLLKKAILHHKIVFS